MAESTLTLTRTELRVRIAHFLGYGRTASAWTTEQGEIIDECLSDGLSAFYFPPNGYEWHFLEPVDTLVVWPSIAVDAGVTVTGGAFAGGSTEITASESSWYPSMVGKTLVITTIGSFVVDGYTSGTVISVTGDASTAAADTFSMTADGTYRLPDDYGNMKSTWTFATNEGFVSIRRMGEQSIRTYYQTSSTPGRPQRGAVRPVASTGASGQRWEAYFYPTPDAVYNLTYRRSVLADALTAGLPYILGGAAHTRTVSEMCLAAAEIKINDEVGIHNAEATKLMAASIHRDKQAGPEFLGYNGDGNARAPSDYDRVPYVTVDDVLYGPNG